MKSHSPPLLIDQSPAFLPLYQELGPEEGGVGMDLVWRSFWSRLTSLGRELYVHFYRPTVLYALCIKLTSKKISRRTWKRHSSPQYYGPRWVYLDPENIKLFIEDQAFLWSYDFFSAPRPPLTPSSLNMLSLFLSLPVFRVLTEGGEGLGEEPNHTTTRKPGHP